MKLFLMVPFGLKCFVLKMCGDNIRCNACNTRSVNVLGGFACNLVKSKREVK